jgi:hypothetical protein
MGTYRQALQQLRPNSRITFYSADENYETLHWKDSNIDPPTKEEVEELVAELQPEWDQWKIDRPAAYPTVEEQLDMLWHMVNRGEHIVKGSTWFEAVKRAKESTPRPDNK